ncbi:AAA family ATPase [Epilithonimonas arachidiradicis]|uniref:ATPase family protein associated with various cellular activities (AAA) n=1 Tax=Epilithonimonas arachidiradicis TaxID=1617282 RepID=A0A420CMI3_9FLAO|nr:AAA family ATPase [Epilithonimonas arachidiradicis]RKE79555.1 ATPase family protein associated with various cellular activities (AAA) [Epilithonimonas arachidiradicis]GGG66138.1 hypothetical protein GCM10007332_30990 [Epilithonimonas arachidiradicis]
MEIKRSHRTSKPENHKNGNSVLENYVHQHLDLIKSKVEQDIKLNLKKDLDHVFKSQLGRSNSEIKKLQATIIQLQENHQVLQEKNKQLNSRIDKLRNYRSVSIRVVDGHKIKDLGLQHYQFEKLLKYVQTKNNIFLVGSAGSGKTTAAKNIAKALGMEFYFTGAITSEFKLTGFMNAHGKIVSTDFRKAYEQGGVFLFDEIDASFPQAILAFNAALANDFMDFPDGRVEKHKDFYCIAAANTYGTGADRQYVGRNQLDAASLDRFIFMSWEIDENLERQLAGNDEWTSYVQKVRKAVAKINERIVISPRASIIGAELLKVGIRRQDVENDVLWKGLEASRVELIKNNINVW